MFTGILTGLVATLILAVALGVGNYFFAWDIRNDIYWRNVARQEIADKNWRVTDDRALIAARSTLLIVLNNMIQSWYVLALDIGVLYVVVAYLLDL